MAFKRAPKAFDVSLLGDRKLDKAFARLPFAMQKKILVKALKKAGQPVLVDIKAAAPQPPTGDATGKLVRSIRLRPLKGKRDKHGVAISTGTRKQLGIAADDPYYYPMALETGTRHIAARPFMRPALKNNQGKVFNLLRRYLRTALNLS